MIGHTYRLERTINVFLEENDRDMIEKYNSLEGRVIIIDGDEKRNVFPFRVAIDNGRNPKLMAADNYELNIPRIILMEDKLRENGFYVLNYVESFESKRLCLIDVVELRKKESVDNHYLELYELLKVLL